MRDPASLVAGATVGPSMLDRRAFLARAAALAAGASGLPACGLVNPTAPVRHSRGGDARLTARPSAAPPAAVLAPGMHRLELGEDRDGLLYVPAGYRADQPAPLLVSFHGAGGAAGGWLSGFVPIADAAGTLMLAPDSRRSTWDAIHGPFGIDVAFVDRALAWVFARCVVDPSRIAAHGFSDGGTYALSLGLANGDLFRKIVAFSPGFLAGAPAHGKPPVLITHGTADPVLPIDRCSRPIAAQLRREGYAVDLREFAGGHVLLVSLATSAAEWVRDG